MDQAEGYLIIDIGTGNVRVAVTKTTGEILRVERDDVRYQKDALYPDALFFDPQELWKQILVLSRKALSGTPGIFIRAITASSQREGIVLIDESGNDIIGLPNHDHRGREFEDTLDEKSHVYALTGRYPGSLFSALKLIGVRKKRPEIYKRLHTVLSISDWAQFRLSGVRGYEHAQASETQLYDVGSRQWSTALCERFGISSSILPPLHDAGNILGKVLTGVADELAISHEVDVIVGGADTQLAIKSTRPAVNDIVIVSGTTTPIVKVVREFITDEKQRTWTNRHVDKGSYILEANAGVTGLNYQRLKEIFYPHEGYDVIERELANISDASCMASLGSLVAEEDRPLTRAGFVFDVPVSPGLTRANFVWATIWDIACCIRENYDCLRDVSGHDADYVWACSGGLQSKTLRQCVADLIGKKIQVRRGFEQASVRGAAIVCNETLNNDQSGEEALEVIFPRDPQRADALYQEWKSVRAAFRKIF